MKFEQALSWYREGRFTADDVTRATGMSEPAQRLLQREGLIHPIPQVRTAQRLLSSLMVKRCALVSGLAKYGVSLRVAGQIVVAAHMLEPCWYDFTDPIDAVFDYTVLGNHRNTGATGLPNLRHRRVSRGEIDDWINQGVAMATFDTDYLLSIVDSRFTTFSTPVREHGYETFGELAPDLTGFTWWGQMSSIERERVINGSIQLSARGQGEWDDPLVLPRYPKTITLKVKFPTAAVQAEAEQAFANPVSILTINANLTIRIALRRLLYIDPVE